MNIDPEATRQITSLVESLQKQGFKLVSAKCDYSNFGDCVVEFSNGKQLLRLIRDRRQWIIAGDIIELQKSGLHRAFDDVDDFGSEVLKWITN